MKLLFLPVDIDLTGFSFTQYDHTLENNAFNPWWNASFISEETAAKNNFSKIVEQLPFNRITRLIYKTQKVKVGPHLDVYPKMLLEENEYDHLVENEPCGYRLVIKGSTDKLEVYNGKQWEVARLPSTPCCYLLDSTAGLHRVAYDESRETIYFRGFVDKEHHKSIIQRSLEKYSSYAIYSK